MCQRVYSHTTVNEPNPSWPWKPTGSGLIHCGMGEILEPKNRNPFLWRLFLVLGLLILFYVHEWLAYICVCAPYACLAPLEFRKRHQIPWDWSNNSCKPPLGAGNQICVLFKNNEYSLLLSQLFGALKQYIPINTSCVPIYATTSPCTNCSQRCSPTQKFTGHWQQKRWATSGPEATSWITWAAMQKSHLQTKQIRCVCGRTWGWMVLPENAIAMSPLWWYCVPPKYCVP